MFYIRAGFTALYVVTDNTIHALLTETHEAKLQRLGQARWSAVLRLKEACAALSNDNNLEDVISFLAKVVAERDAEFRQHMEDMHEEICTCSAEDEEEEVL